MKCTECNNEADECWRNHCDECEMYGTYFQYELSEMWSFEKDNFIEEMKKWKISLTEDERKKIKRWWKK